MNYENNWASLDKRPVPEWFEDAKLGIFIHWGLYSVPAYAPKGKYAEWYGYHCQGIKTDDSREYYEYHKKTYGENFKYTDFVPMFTAENFDARKWVQLFKEAGAKYINFVSKHHDGFCMYESSHSKGFDSVKQGPHRDFCHELKEACDKEGIKFGIYHSLFEWFDPICNIDTEKYAKEKLIPMLKELVEKYKPYTLFADGEWAHSSEVWHSEDFLAWLYNESSVKDVIVPNDRWGCETRGRHGGNLTTEYGITDAADGCVEFADKVTEECRGIGHSFGYNRYETEDDYLSGEELIKLLVKLSSKGSNLLLNVGPDRHGNIPEIMAKRLKTLGKWLKINGEGIYKSRKYCVCTDENVSFTRSKDGKTIYAFINKFPNQKLTLDAVPYKTNAKAELLGCKKDLKTENTNGKLSVVFDNVRGSDTNSFCVYTVKINLQ